LASAGLTLASCAKDGAETDAAIKMEAKTFKMGERAVVGLLTYNVLEASYVSQLGDAGQSKIPQDRYLVIRLAITNGGPKEMELPLFRLADASGTEFGEVQDAIFLKGWLGIVRKIGPTQTEEGRILFDVKPKVYKLIVTDGGETGKEQMGFVDIPIDFDTAEPVPTGGQIAPKP